MRECWIVGTRGMGTWTPIMVFDDRGSAEAMVSELYARRASEDAAARIMWATGALKDGDEVPWPSSGDERFVIASALVEGGGDPAAYEPSQQPFVTAPGVGATDPGLVAAYLREYAPHISEEERLALSRLAARSEVPR